VLAGAGARERDAPTTWSSLFDTGLKRHAETTNASLGDWLASALQARRRAGGEQPLPRGSWGWRTSSPEEG